MSAYPVKKFGRVAVLMGGNAAERDISLQSGTAVYQALLRSGVDVTAFDIKTDVFAVFDAEKFDRVVNMIHGRGGEDGRLQALLEYKGIAYTGSGILASALSMDKLRTKLCWQGAGLATPKWLVLKTHEDIARCVTVLGFPVMVKPAEEGSSLGMSRADNSAELLTAWQVAKRYECEVYAEAWVHGDEYTVAIVAGQALPIIRLQTPHVFYDFAAKYRASTTQYHCPSGLNHAQEQHLAQLSLTACEVLGVTGWARVDVFIETEGNAQLIEVNTVPGMTDHSLVPMAAQAAGMSFETLVLAILDSSL